MSLAPLQLDDLTWSNLVESARERIPAASRGEWTLHAPVDPGMTLLELFASQLEQRLFWMDQPSDARTAALLRLMGISSRPVGVATTVLRFSPPEQLAHSATFVRRGTVMQLGDDERDLDRQPAFATIRNLTVLPLSLREPPSRRVRRQRPIVPAPNLELRVAGECRSVELQAGRAPCLFAADGDVRDAEIILKLTSSAPVGGAIALYFDLESPASVQPQWVQDFVDDGADPVKVAPAAQLSWSYWNGRAFQSCSPICVEDGTHGLRRSGVVRLRIPDGAWKHSINYQFSLQPTSGFAFRLRLVANHPTFTFLPRVRQIVPNAVIARHLRLRRSETLGACDLTQLTGEILGWQPLSGNVLTLPFDAFGDLPIPRNAMALSRRAESCQCGRTSAKVRTRYPIRLLLRERATPSELQTWTAVDSFAHSGPGDRHFVVDREAAVLRFGDGLSGRIPVPAIGPLANYFQLEYEVGGGLKGNLPAALRWIECGADPLVGCDSRQRAVQRHSAVNVTAAAGGAEAETLDAASGRASRELRKRAVTKADIEYLAIATSGAGIKRAHAVVGMLPQHAHLPTPGAATVIVVPDLPSSLRTMGDRSCGDDLVALVPDAGAMQAVERYLDCARLLTHEFHVLPPTYVEVALHVDLVGAASDAEAMQIKVVQALHQYLHPLYGGPKETGWPFGGAIRPSELVRCVQRALDHELQVRQIKVGVLRPSKCGCQSAHRASGHGDCHHCGTTSHQAGAIQFESCKDVEIPPHALVALRAVTVAFSRPQGARAGGVL
jgi:hypothetical protein